MTTLLRVVSRLPVPRALRLAWSRALLKRTYATDIAAAWKLKDYKKAESLELERQHELDMHDEEEDDHLTETLVARARRLRIPIPHLYNEDNTVSDHWREGRYICLWYLSTDGIAALREEIRREVKARQEARSHWIAWLSALTGVVGAVTGLVALLSRKCP